MKLKLKKFLALGAIAVATTLLLLPTNEVSNNIKNLSKEAAYLFVDSPQQNIYQEELTKNINFLKEKHPEFLIDVDFVIKDNTKVINKLVYLVNKANADLNPDLTNKTQAEFEAGNLNIYMSSIKTVFLGVNSLTSHHEEIQGINFAFNNNKEQIRSFIMFHELGHHIFYQYGYNKIFDKHLEKIQEDKKILFKDADLTILKRQTNESFADTFALLLMKEKYSQLDMEQVIKVIGGWRVDNSIMNNDIEHITTVALSELMKKMENKGNKQPLLDICFDTAQKSLFFAADTDFENNKRYLLSIQEQNNISDKIAQMRESYKYQKMLRSI